ncbi:hypothetical protein [Thermococcus stetteri]|uniref:hypothetical protein n=1 Tax=Thermococcus stetteri TaxID=49900 RepID=UPI001AE6D90E|nr:hypothetical protein [Thermococcus stetteri]MBP1911764.1 hypothetical protein [Thermococcus stetteri]
MFRSLSVLSATTGMLIVVVELLMVLHARFSTLSLFIEGGDRYVSFGLLIVTLLLYSPVPLSFFLLAGLIHPGEIKYLKAISPFLTAVAVVSLAISVLMALRMDVLGFLSFLTVALFSASLVRKERLHKSEKFKPLAWSLTALCVLQAILFGALLLLP